MNLISKAQGYIQGESGPAMSNITFCDDENIVYLCCPIDTGDVTIEKQLVWPRN